MLHWLKMDGMNEEYVGRERLHELVVRMHNFSHLLVTSRSK